METTLHEILSRKGSELVSVTAEALVSDAVGVMVEKNVGSVLVMDGERLTGLFTERDLMVRVVHAARDPKATPVREVMTREVAAVSPTVRLEEAMSLCTERRVRHLPVYEGDRLIGIVSSGDLTKAAVKDQQHTIDDLVRYIYGGEAS